MYACQVCLVMKVQNLKIDSNNYGAQCPVKQWILIMTIYNMFSGFQHMILKFVK